MIELVQLERRHEDFARRNARVIAVSMDGPDDSQRTQERFPHLVILSDSSRGLSEAAQVVHAHARPDGGEADAPTTILVDRDGQVRWLYRSPEIVARLSPDEVLAAIDEHMPATK
jgi:peroxiredoxin